MLNFGTSAPLLAMQCYRQAQIFNIMSQTEIKTEQTLGEARVRTSFNPSDAGNVSFIKQKTAELINVLEAYKTDERYNHSSEALRLIQIAQTSFEEAAMWGVKAVTS